MHSPSVHTGHVPGRSCRHCWPEAVPGTAGALVGLRLQTKSFIPVGLTWYFFFVCFLLFLLHLWGTESTKYTLVEVTFSDVSHSPNMLLENKTGASLKP